MSLSGQRAELAAILSDVAGVSAAAYRPRSLTAGSAWPQLVDLTRTAEVPDLAARWRVWVVLPAEEIAASVWMDDHVGPIDDALAEFGYVEQIEPVSIKTDAGDVNAVTFTIRREA